MRYLKYYIVGAAVIIVAVAIFLVKSNFGSKQPVSIKPEKAPVSATPEIIKKPAEVVPVSQPAQFCPQPEDLIKEEFKWTTKDKRWENYTPSSATKVLSFTGAQWVGITVGKVICLYQTNEAVSFPVALEQTSSQLILEPKSTSWSALVGNRRFCKSASVADCPYFIEPQKNTSNIYKEIEYAPKTE